jgi:hypothetical protein
MPLGKKHDKKVSTVYPDRRAVELLGGYSIPRLNAAIEQFAARLGRVPDRRRELPDEQREQLDALLDDLRFDWMDPEPTRRLADRARMVGMNNLADVVGGWSPDERMAYVFRYARKV